MTTGLDGSQYEYIHLDMYYLLPPILGLQMNGKIKYDQKIQLGLTPAVVLLKPLYMFFSWLIISRGVMN